MYYTIRTMQYKALADDIIGSNYFMYAFAVSSKGARCTQHTLHAAGIQVPISKISFKF